jgi:acyl carrier protein
MTRDEIRSTVLTVLSRIVPEADPATIQPAMRLRDQLDLDSMDVLNLAIGLHEALGVDIPEVEYPRLGTLESATEYLEGKLAAMSAGSGRPPALPPP